MSGQVANRIFMLAIALSMVAESQSCIAAQDAPQQYIPSSAFALLDVKPKAALAQPSMDLVPRELIKVFGEKELGINLLEIKRITCLVDRISDPEMSEPPEFGVVIQFDSPQQLSTKVLEELEETTIDNHQAYLIDGGEAMLIMVEDKTLMLGMTSYLKKMLNARGASSPLITQLANSPQEDHLNVFVMVEPVRAIIKEALPPREQVPPPLSRFLKLPDLIGSLSYRANFSENEVSELTIGANDAASVEEINRLIDHGIELAKTAALSAIAEQVDFDDPDYRQAIMDYTERLSTAIKQGLQPEVRGTDLVYDLNSHQNSGAISVATIGIWTGMLLPAVQQVREAARRTEAANSVRQLALGALNYESAYQHFPMQASYDESGKPLLSWRVHLLPFMEHNNLYEQFNLSESWDSPHNIKLLDQMPPVFKSANFDDDQRTVFLAVSGEGTVFPGNKKIRFKDITDGSSNTALFVEADPEMAVEWTRPVDWEMDPANPLRGLGNLRPGGFNTAFCDGSIQFIQKNIDPEMWLRIVLKADGEVVDR